MRLSMTRASIVAMAGAIALAACAGHGLVPPQSQSVTSLSQNDGAMMPEGAMSPDLTTCATSPPQYMWIFNGACTTITLKPAGAKFSLQKYRNITVTGQIGKNNLKASAKVAIVDATGSADIKTYKGKAFPKYKAHGKTFIYASAINQGKTAIKPIIQQGHPVLQYVITDAKGIPGHQCGAGVLTNNGHGGLIWKALNVQAQVKGKTVTISQYVVPHGFALYPKTPLYLGVNCF
jgi:hypothetical protein